MSSLSKSLHELDCPTRMFLVSLCLSDADLTRLGAMPVASPCGGVSQRTAARAALHRACARSGPAARAMADLLDLRHLELVANVRALDACSIAALAEAHAREASGAELAGWAWALLTDPRPAVVLQGRLYMSECYVRGLQNLVRA